jgi:Zn-dependent peptidase ImmA (M78 family)
MLAATPDARATTLLRHLCITQPSEISVDDIAWIRGALVRDENLKGAEARLVTFSNRAIISVSTHIIEHGRRRFAIAHEIGHLELHKQVSSLALCVVSDLDLKPLEESACPQTEQEANTFASALLMPDFLFRPACQKRAPSFSLIEQLATDFGTTLTATALRYMAFCPERCAVVFSQDRCIRWYKATSDFGYHIPVHDALDPYSLAVDFFDSKATSGRMETVDASTWLRGRYRPNAMIKEESRPLSRYNAVLSLLWIHEEIEPDPHDWDDTETFTPDGRWRRRE